MQPSAQARQQILQKRSTAPAINQGSKIAPYTLGMATRETAECDPH